MRGAEFDSIVQPLTLNQKKSIKLHKIRFLTIEIKNKAASKIEKCFCKLPATLKLARSIYLCIYLYIIKKLHDS